MPLLLRSVYRNTGRLWPAYLSNAKPKNCLLMLRPGAAGLVLAAWAWVAVTAPPTPNATMAARPMSGQPAETSLSSDLAHNALPS